MLCCTYITLALKMFRYSGIFLLCFALVSSEPECSRFHYEEQTLRKMITVEMLVERLESDLKTITKNVGSALEKLQNERQAIDTLKTETVSSVEQLQETIKENEDKFKEEIQTIKGSIGRDMVMFVARGLKDLSPKRNDILVFTNTMVNMGSGYDNATGTFTVPMTGTYMLTLQLFVRNKKYVFFEITNEQNELMKSVNIDDADPNASCLSTSFPAFLNFGETVSVKVGRLSTDALWESNAGWNMFSGVLVQH